MRRAKQLIGLPVIDLTSGKRLASVQSALVDLAGGEVVALVVQKSGWLKDGKALRMSDLHAIGDDAITVSNPEPWVAVSKVTDGRPGLVTADRLRDRQVLTEDGRLLGSLEDVIIDSPSGTISEYVLSDGIIQDLLNGRVSIPVPEQAVVGEESIIVPMSVNRPEDDNKLPEELRMDINPPD